MDIPSFFGASTSSSVVSSNTHTEKRSNCSDSDSDIAEPHSKKACRELIQPLTMKRKYSNNRENEFSWLVYDEDINGAFFRVCNRPQQRTPHSTQEVFGSQKCFRIGRKLLREWKLMREVASTHKPVKPASHIKTGLSDAATTEGRYAWKREEQSCNEISCTLHSLSYPAPYCSLYQFHSISWFSRVLWS